MGLLLHCLNGSAELGRLSELRARLVIDVHSIRGSLGLGTSGVHERVAGRLEGVGVHHK